MEPTSAASIPGRMTRMTRLTREGLDSTGRGGQAGGGCSFNFPVAHSKNTSLNREYLEQLLRQFSLSIRGWSRCGTRAWNNAKTIAEFMSHNVGFCNIDSRCWVRSLVSDGTCDVGSGIMFGCTDGTMSSGSTPIIATIAITISTKPAELEKWRR